MTFLFSKSTGFLLKKNNTSKFFFIGNYHNLKPKLVFKMLKEYHTIRPSECQSTDLLSTPDPTEAFFYVCCRFNDDTSLADGYVWKSVGSKPTNYGVTVRYFQIVQPPKDASISRQATCSSEFCKKIYTLTDEEFQKDAPVIVWYNGNKNMVQKVVHGNSKVDKQYVYTVPSVRQQIKEKVKFEKSNEKILINIKNSVNVANCKLSFFKKFKYIAFV